MSTSTLHDLQASVHDRNAFKKIEDYFLIAQEFLGLLTEKPTRIVSPSTPTYIFYQYSSDHGNRISRPLNTTLFVENGAVLGKQCDAFLGYLSFNGQTEAIHAWRQTLPKMCWT